MWTMAVLWTHTCVYETKKKKFRYELSLGALLLKAYSQSVVWGCALSASPVGWWECRVPGSFLALPALTRSIHSCVRSLDLRSSLLASSFYKCWKRKQGMNKLMEFTRRLNSHGRSLETLSPDSGACDLSTTLCCYVIKISYCGFFLSLRGSRLSSFCLKDVSKMWDGRWSF